MFDGPSSFNQTLEAWDVGNVREMNGMFLFYNNASSFFDQPLDVWDVGKVTSMDRMFDGASLFNQSCNLKQNIEQWSCHKLSGAYPGQKILMWILLKRAILSVILNSSKMCEQTKCILVQYITVYSIVL